MKTERTQRWRDRRWRMIGRDAEIDPKTLSVDVIESDRTVGDFVRQHHYAGTLPPTKLKVGLFANGVAGTSRLVGICAFTVPMNNASIRKTTGLESPDQGCDLGRLVLLDEVGCNGESFLVSRAFRLLRREKPAILSVISYADPIRRLDEEGNVVLPGHVGVLYAMMNARYTGRSSKRTDLIMPNGRLLSPRTRSKIRNGEQGRDGGIAQLVSAGARPRAFAEDPAAWLEALEREGFLSRRVHPGNHTYCFPLTRAGRHAACTVPQYEYPEIARGTADGDVTAMPLLKNAA